MSNDDTNINNHKDDNDEITRHISNNYGFDPSIVHISTHPVISHKITILRSSATHSATFRAVLKELTYHLGYEATRLLQTVPVQISVPLPKKMKSNNKIDSNKNNDDTNKNDDDNNDEHAEYMGHKLKEHIALIPILRSGLGMIDSMMELLPTAEVHHIGMYKSAVPNGQPVLYYIRLPKKCNADTAYILDPLIATAQTVKSVVSILKKWGVSKIHVLCVIGSVPGIQSLLDEYPDIQVTVGTIDLDITDDGHILPGLGDAGDRLFGTVPAVEDDESLLHPSRRKRTFSQSLP